MTVAADLVPWWFAGAFWLAFAALVVVVARDVRRAGGVRAVIGAVQRALEQRAAEPRRGEQPADDPRPPGEGEGPVSDEAPGAAGAADRD